MPAFKLKPLLFAAALLGLTACGGGSNDTTLADDPVPPNGISIPDPAQPVAVDVTVGGAFEGTTPPTPPDDLQPDTAPAIVYRDSDTNRLSAADIARAPEFGYEQFVAAYDQVRSTEPGLNTSSNAFANKLIDRLVASAAAGPRVQLAGAYDTFEKLTPAEKELVLLNPLKAHKTSTAVSDAFAATAALFSADPSKYLTRADAFRHSYWNWLISKCCTVEWATAITTAHESQAANNDDKRMDLNNNMIGRRLYTAAPNRTPAEAQAALLDYKLLWINSAMKNVTVGVDYLVYLAPKQNMTVYDDGPSYDDIYTVSFNGTVLGDTPSGASRKFEFDQLPSGNHQLNIFCKTDGTQGGCGFAILTEGASRLSNGQKSTPQIIIRESGTHTEAVSFATMQTLRVD